MPERGRYIVIEGSDGTGKSTQAMRLSQHLIELGHQVLLTPNAESGQLEPIQEPGGTPEADKIRIWLKDKSIERTPWQDVEKFTEARRLVWNERILPALESGMHVITARSWISTVAYQGYGDGISIDRIRDYTRQQVGDAYMSPDLVCILAITNEQVRKQRIMQRGDESYQDTYESKPEAFQYNMQDGYVRYAKENGILLIDAGQTKDAVFQAIWTEVQKLLLQG